MMGPGTRCLSNPKDSLLDSLQLPALDTPARIWSELNNTYIYNAPVIIFNIHTEFLQLYIYSDSLQTSIGHARGFVVWAGPTFVRPHRWRPWVMLIQTGREEIWPFVRNEKNQIGKSEEKWPKPIKNLLEKMESRNSCSVKVGGVGVEGMATLSKVGALVWDWRIG